MKRAFKLTSVFALFLGLSAVVHAEETKGTIKSIDTGRKEVVLKGTIKDSIYELAKNGTVWLDGASSKLSELRADDSAIVLYDKEGEHMIAVQIRVLRSYKEATGTVKDVFGEKREVTLKGTVKNTTYELNKDGTVYLNGKKDWVASSPANPGSHGTILDSRAVLIAFAIIFAIAFAAGCVSIAGVERDNALFILPPAVLGILLCCVLELLALVLLTLSSLPRP